MDTLEHPTGDRVEAAPRFAPGTSLGHFRVIGELGAGGMGIVFEAIDPDLDRRVAIKVVRDREATSSAGERLIREAKAMARLSHPNVVTVHEVGTVDGQVFLVMELIRGETLASWLRTPRSWRDIVAAFVQAGDGLAAAHEAGLVHRDFKPTNVLIDAQGRVRVGDFGLAHDPGEVPARLAVGSPAGTPGYMAPEQQSGAPVDARADQYSFAVSLDEALRGAKLPRRIRRALAVALAADPAARFPHLAELVTELRRGLEARRRRVLAFGGAMLGAAAVAALVSARLRTVDDCADGADLVDALWNPPIAATQAAAFTAARPGASVAIANTSRVLDGWTNAWRLGRRTACSADPTPRAARLACLDAALEELRAQLAAWEHPDRTAVDLAPKAASSLPDPAACANRTTGEQAPWHVQPLLARAAAIRAAHRAGHARAMKAELAPLLAAARESGDPHAIASALLSAGTIEHALGDLERSHTDFHDAAVAAGRANDDDLLFDALRDEAIAVTDLGRPNDSLGILDAADAVSARAKLDKEWQLAVARGNTLVEAGRLAEGAAALERAIAILEPRASDPKYAIELATTLDILATSKVESEEYATALALMTRGVGLLEKSLGPNHPDLGKAYGDLAEVEANADKPADAERHVMQARKIFVEAYGPDHVLVAEIDVTNANIAARARRADDAVALYAKASEELRGKMPPDSMPFTSIETGWAAVEHNRDHCEAALPHYERAFEILEHRSPSGATIGGLLIGYAECLASVDRTADAQRAALRSLNELEHAGAPPDQIAETWVTLADLEHNLGHAPRAIELATKMLDATASSKSPEVAQMRAYETKQLAAWKR